MIYIVRHGQTDANRQDIIRGRYFDDELNAEGIKQAEEIAEQLKNINFDICFCSPLKRTVQTCKQIYRGKISLDEHLLPRDYGELIKLGETAAYLDKNGFWNRELNHPVKNGESVLQVENRMKKFLAEITGKHPNKNVLVVTHGSLVSVIKGIIDNHKLGPEYMAYKTKNCEVVKIPN